MGILFCFVVFNRLTAKKPKNKAIKMTMMRASEVELCCTHRAASLLCHQFSNDFLLLLSVISHFFVSLSLSLSLFPSLMAATKKDFFFGSHKTSIFANYVSFSDGETKKELLLLFFVVKRF